MQIQEPEYLYRLMNTISRSGRLIIPNTRLSLAMNSYCFRATTHWNKLPDVIRQSPLMYIVHFQEEIEDMDLSEYFSACQSLTTSIRGICRG